MANTLLRTLALSLSLALASMAAHSATLTEEAAVKLAPSEAAAVLRVLPAGSELRPAPTGTASAPENWQAVSLDGPFTLYVRNGDIDKGLAIKPASPLYLEPDNAAAVVAYAEEGDSITITGLHGRWTQIELDKPLTGYVAASAIKAGNAPATTSATAPAISTLPVPIPSPAKTGSPTASTEDATVESPEAGATETEATTPQLVSQVDTLPEPAVETVAVSKGEGSAARADLRASPALNRSQIQGKLVSTRKRFAPRRPYDWQINAKFSFRIAYLDFSRMQGTDQLARYEGQQVVVYGLVNPLGDGQYVMQVESIRLQ